jgi:hypothetical protein
MFDNTPLLYKFGRYLLNGDKRIFKTRHNLVLSKLSNHYLII